MDLITSLPLLLLFLLNPAASSPAGLLPVKSICGKSTYPDQCISSINSMVPGLATVDPTTVLKLHIEAAAVNAQAALRHATAISEDPKAPPLTKSVIERCIKVYGSVSKSLEQAHKALQHNDRVKMMAHLDHIPASSAKCEVAFKEKRMESPLKEYADMNQHLTANAVAIANFFWPETAPSKSVHASPGAPVVDDDYSDLLGPPPSSSASSSAAVKSVCDKSKYPEQCLSSVESVASGPLDSADAATVLKLMIQDTIFTTQSGIDRAKVFAKASDTNTKNILKKCAGGYGSALVGLQDASNAVANNHKGNIRSKLEQILPLYSSCEDAFEEAHLDSPMGEYTAALEQLAENNLSIATAFWQ